MKSRQTMPLEAVRGEPTLPRYPASWYFLCRSRDLVAGSKKPRRFQVAAKQLVAFRAEDGRIVVLDARCCHFGSDLSLGVVDQGCIRCSFHGWQFDGQGHCVNIPGQEEIPPWAGQRCYPAEEHFGQVYFFRGEKALFPFPFFENQKEAELLPSRLFELEPKCAWYMVSANGFDMQHFRMSHDRVLCGEPRLEQIHPYGLRVKIPLLVPKTSLWNRMLSTFAGKEINFTVTCWGGTLMLVEAKFRRTTSYGFVSLLPVSSQQTSHRNTVFVRRSKNMLLRLIFDPLNIRFRRLAIRRFVSADLHRIAGTNFSPSHCIEADRELLTFFTWLKAMGEPVKIADAKMG